jgi:signal transduction histidine kinase
LKNEPATGLRLPSWRESKHWWSKKVPLDIRFLVFAFVAIEVVNLFMSHSLMIGYSIFNVLRDTLMLVFLFLNLVGAVKLLINRSRLKKELASCAMVKLYRLLHIGLLRLPLPRKIGGIALAMLISGFFIGMPLGAAAVGGGDGEFFLLFLFLFGFVLAVIYPAIRQDIRQWHAVRTGARELAAGNLELTLPEGQTGELFQLAADMNRMKLGFRQAVDSRIKSERMKSELVTNVSHDLKTPLTSLINYVDLLQKPEITEEERTRYIEVLSRQTGRLKTLVEDLFDAAKMASGAVDLHLSTVDLVELVDQALAEYNDKLDEARLTFRLRSSAAHLYAIVDGNQTWRIMENLLGNVLKYAMPGTRVYLTLSEEEGQAELTLQNISLHELDLDSEEIFERFKRGDGSRSTEGSGLGLAIARSIAELQGGSLRVELDGDQFKAVVRFVKSEEGAAVQTEGGGAFQTEKGGAIQTEKGGAFQTAEGVVARTE